jgi:hypothetical protein
VSDTPRTDAIAFYARSVTGALGEVVAADAARGFEREIATLLAQLPEGMKDCTIVFVACPKGHGRLTATNWTPHECQVCREMELLEQIQDLKDEIRDW